MAVVGKSHNGTMRTRLTQLVGFLPVLLAMATFARTEQVLVPVEKFSDPPRPSAAAKAKTEKLKLAVAQQPDSAETWSDLGWGLYKEGRYGECEWAMGEARSRKPDDPYALWLSGLASYAMGHYPEAKEYLWKMWNNNKTWPNTVDMAVTYELLGRIALQNRDLFQVSYFLGKSAEEAPDNWQVQFLLGFGEWYREHYGKAADALKKAYALNPKHPLVVQYYAWARAAVDERELAYAKDAVAEKGSGPEEAKEAQQAERNYKNDLDLIRKAIDANPNYPVNVELLGRYYVSLGQNEEAIHAFRQATSLSEKSAAAPYLLAKSLLFTGGAEARSEAKKLLVESIAIAPGYWEGSLEAPHAGLLISILIEDGQMEQAQALADWVEAQNAQEQDQ